MRVLFLFNFIWSWSTKMHEKVKLVIKVYLNHPFNKIILFTQERVKFLNSQLPNHYSLIKCVGNTRNFHLKSSKRVKSG